MVPEVLKYQYWRFGVYYPLMNILRLRSHWICDAGEGR